MRYELRLKRDGFSIEAGEAKGRALPDWVTDVPGETDTDDFYLRSFWNLSTCRQVGFGIGPIPWNFIHDYARIKKLDLEASDLFIESILAMDRVYIEWEIAEAEARRKANEGKK